MFLQDSDDDESDDEDNPAKKACESIAKAMGTTKKVRWLALFCTSAPRAHALHQAKRRLSMMAWQAALHRMTLAGAVTGMWNYSSALGHIEVCLAIAGWLLLLRAWALRG